jgi:hypothetical protein|eukprot:COSAG06_NODE_20_length_33882_cov_18.856969_7_plen_138_part_00
MARARARELPQRERPLTSFQCPPFPPSLPLNCCGPPSSSAGARQAPPRWPSLHLHGSPPSPGALWIGAQPFGPSTHALPLLRHHVPLPAIRRWQSTRYGTACQPTCASMLVRHELAYSFAHFHGWSPRAGSQLQTME